MEAESLTAACELAFSVARQGVETTPPVDPPTPMRSFLYVAQLPTRAITVAERVLDEDPEFRAKVAQAASPESVGQVGYLWLTRPAGWEDQIAAIESGEELPVEQDEPQSDVSDQDSSDQNDSDQNDSDVGGAVATAGAGGILGSALAATDPASTPPPPPAPRPTASGTHTSSEEIREEISSLQGLASKLSQDRQQFSTDITKVPSTEADGSISEQIEALRDDLATIRAERDRAQESREDSLSRQAELADEIAELRRVIAALEQERTHIQTTLAEAEEHVSSVQVVVTNLETQRDQVIAERDAATEERDSVTAQRDTVLNERNAVTAERDAVIAERDGVISERDALTEERDALTARRDELTSEIESLTSERDSLAVERDELEGKGEALRSEFVTLQGEHAAVGEELQRLDSEIATTSATRVEVVQSLTGQLSSIKSERDQLAAELEKSQQNLAALRSVFANMASELNNADAIAETVKTSKASLNSAIDSTDNGIQALSSLSEPDAPNMSLLNSEVASDAADATFTSNPLKAQRPVSGISKGAAGAGVAAAAAAATGASVPPPPPTPDSVMQSNGGPAYEAPKPPTIGGSSDDLDSVGDEISEELGDSAEAAPARTAIEIPSGMDYDSVEMARHVAESDDVILLIQGDAVASLGWTDMSLFDQRDALVKYLNELAGDTGAAPDVMFDKGIGDESALPESHIVRVRLSSDSGTDLDQLITLIETYPHEWPIAVVTDDEVAAAKAKALGATVLGCNQLLDLFS